jgi:hypothetical protein
MYDYYFLWVARRRRKSGEQRQQDPQSASDLCLAYGKHSANLTQRQESKSAEKEHQLLT